MQNSKTKEKTQIVHLSGYWTEIKPKGLSRQKNRDTWFFAEYYEVPSQRDDGQWYTALLFRNEKRTLFGIKEFPGSTLHHDDLRQMANKIIQDKGFRESLLSDNPDLPKMWKKR
jgi:hypothetical protein